MDDATMRWLGWAVGTLLVLAALSAFLMRYAAFSGFLRETERFALADDVVRQVEEAASGMDSGEAAQANPHEFMAGQAIASDLRWTGRTIAGTCSGVQLVAVLMAAEGGRSEPMAAEGGQAEPMAAEGGQAEPMAQVIVLIDGIPLAEVSLSTIDHNRVYRFEHEVSEDGMVERTRYEILP